MTSPTIAKVTGSRRTPAPRRHKKRLTFDKVSFMIVFLALPLAIFLVFVISPFVQALYYSMTDWGGFSATMNFIGLNNFVKLFNDNIFMHSVLNNVLLAIVVPAVTIGIAIILAGVLTVGGPSKGQIRGIKASGFYRTVSFFPYCIPAIVIGLIWSQVFDPSAGILNGFLTGIGLHGFENFAWLGNVATALPAMMFVMIWAFIGFYTVLFVAAIKGIPAELYEAIRLDGGGRFRTAISLTIPQILDTVQTAYIYIGIASLDAFVFAAAMFPNAGGPANTTLVMSQELFNTAFRKGQFGYATAMGVVLAAVTMAFAAIAFFIFRLVKGRESGKAKR